MEDWIAIALRRVVIYVLDPAAIVLSPTHGKHVAIVVARIGNDATASICDQATI